MPIKREERLDRETERAIVYAQELRRRLLEGDKSQPETVRAARPTYTVFGVSICNFSERGVLQLLALSDIKSQSRSDKGPEDMQECEDEMVDRDACGDS